MEQSASVGQWALPGRAIGSALNINQRPHGLNIKVPPVKKVTVDPGYPGEEQVSLDKPFGPPEIKELKNRDTRQVTRPSTGISSSLESSVPTLKKHKTVF